MTERQKRFCDEYLIDLNATQAAIRAGYSEKTAEQTASRLLSFVKVKTYISEQLERIHNENTADAQEVMEYLTAVMRGNSVSHVLAFVGDGYQKVIKKPPDEKEKLKAAELLGKRYGLFKENVDVSVANSVKLDEIMNQLGGKGLDE